MGCLNVILSRVGGDLNVIVSPVCATTVDRTIVALQDSEEFFLISNDDKKLLAKLIQ